MEVVADRRCGRTPPGSASAGEISAARASRAARPGRSRARARPPREVGRGHSSRVRKPRSTSRGSVGSAQPRRTAPCRRLHVEHDDVGAEPAVLGARDPRHEMEVPAATHAGLVATFRRPAMRRERPALRGLGLGVRLRLDGDVGEDTSVRMVEQALTDGERLHHVDSSRRRSASGPTPLRRRIAGEARPAASRACSASSTVPSAVTTPRWRASRRRRRGRRGSPRGATGWGEPEPDRGRRAPRSSACRRRRSPEKGRRRRKSPGRPDRRAEGPLPARPSRNERALVCGRPVGVHGRGAELGPRAVEERAEIRKRPSRPPLVVVRRGACGQRASVHRRGAAKDASAERATVLAARAPEMRLGDLARVGDVHGPAAPASGP